MRSLLLAAVPAAAMAVVQVALIDGYSPSQAGRLVSAGKLITGEVSAVGDNLLRLRIEDGQGGPAKEIPFTLTEKTEVLVAGRPGAIEDLHPGLSVAVAARQDGDRLIAQRIEVEPVRG